MIIAEIGNNHNGDVELAKKMIDSAKDCGCDIVKFQSWTYDSLFSKEFKEIEEDARQYSLNKDEFKEIVRYCKGIEFLCTPFSEEEVDFLVDMGMKRIKVASMDLNNLEFLRYIAKQNLPVILSTGMGRKAEIIEAVWTIEDYNKDLTLLHCVSSYPPRDESINLDNIRMLKDMYPGHKVGYSDHSIGVEIPIAAAGIGAEVIEKHFTLDKNMDGWDHGISADPQEMKAIVDGVKRVKSAIGRYKRYPSKEEQKMKQQFRRSAVATRDIKKGDVVSREDIKFLRPGTGIPPNLVTHVVGHKAIKNIQKDTILKWGDLYAYWNRPSKDEQSKATR